MFEVSPTTEVLARSLDVCALRQAVHTANIANVNVTGYRRLEVRFDDLAMRAEAALLDAKSATPATTNAEVVTTHDTVKLDEEMAAMAKNAMRYEMLLNFYENSLGSLRAAIREGRGG